MNVIAFILMIIAAVLFLVDGNIFGRSSMAWGLCLLTVGLIVQFITVSHTFVIK